MSLDDNSKSPSTEFQRMLETEAVSFLHLFDRFRSVSDILESILLWSGAVGNLLALITLCTSRHMRTVSFAYHKCLMVAHFVYCLNFLAVKYSEERHLLERLPAPAFDNYILAYYIGVVSRVIASATGFLAMYTALAISVDRFIALLAFTRYSAFNRAPVACAWISCSLIFSLAFNSWSPWIEKSITAKNQLSPSDSNKTDIDFSVIYAIEKTAVDENTLAAIHIKNLCNAIVRCGYLLVLLALTLAVIRRFVRQRRRRRSMTRLNTKRRRRDHSLYLLMIAILVLAYVQVVPREVKRAFEFIYPESFVERQIDNERLSIDDRRFYVRLYFYVYVLSTQITNVCTATERSLFFYLNVFLNYNFRHELLALIKKVFRLPTGSRQSAMEKSAGWYSTSGVHHARSINVTASAERSTRRLLYSANSNEMAL